MRKLFAALVLVGTVMWAAAAFAAAPIVVDGSTTVLPFAQAGVEQYMKQNPGVKFSVSGTGTGNGFKSLADGSAKIADASRFIKDSEVKTCMDKKVYPVPFAIALDCIVPIVHPGNKVKSLSLEQLKNIYAGKVINWKEVGGADAPIVVVGRDSSSGTNGTWQELVMDRDGKTRVTPKAPGRGFQRAMMTTIAQNKNAIGYDGWVTSAISQACRSTASRPAQRRQKRQNSVLPLPLHVHQRLARRRRHGLINFMLAGRQKIVASTGFVPLQELGKGK